MRRRTGDGCEDGNATATVEDDTQHNRGDDGDEEFDHGYEAGGYGDDDTLTSRRDGMRGQNDADHGSVRQNYGAERLVGANIPLDEEEDEDDDFVGYRDEFDEAIDEQNLGHANGSGTCVGGGDGHDHDHDDNDEEEEKRRQALMRGERDSDSEM